MDFKKARRVDGGEERMGGDERVREMNGWGRRMGEKKM